MSKNMRKKKQKLARRDPFPPSYYVLKLNEMESLNYPLPVVDGKSISPPEGYAATAPGDGSRDGKLVGLDCEMCWTKEGLELTRVTLVDEDGMVLLDEFVMPTNQITDYNTKYSGITEEMLKGVTTTLEDVRHKVMEIVHDKTLLVGHGLENDLRSLRLLHANCIDTVVLYPHPKGLPHRPSLRFLAEKFLKKSIQGERHDSIEDASSAMKLAKLKFKHGPSWGTGSMPNMEPLVDTLARDGCRCALVASSTSLRHNAQGSADAIVAETDDQSLEKIKQKARQEDIHFIWGQWSDIGNFQAERASVRKELSSMGVALDPSCPHLDDAADADRRRHHPAAGGGVAPGNGAAGDPHAAERGSGGASYGQVLRRVDDRVAELWEGLEPNTLLVLVSGHGDSSEARRLQETKCRRTQETPLDGLPAWTARDEELAQALVKRTGRTICLAAVRQ
uniref:RNA exonuclease 1 n=1 Tax=Tetraselmis sp. GSL018 TaxID=582737 RepID=A0A061SHQ1_9CHLO